MSVTPFLCRCWPHVYHPISMQVCEKTVEILAAAAGVHGSHGPAPLGTVQEAKQLLVRLHGYEICMGVKYAWVQNTHGAGHATDI